MGEYFTNLKARRIVREGRVRNVLLLDTPRGLRVYANVLGSDIYDVYLFEDGRYSCTCLWATMHPSSKCSHVKALEIYLRRNFGIELEGFENGRRRAKGNSGPRGWNDS